jgi:hypothetical protein
MMRIGDGIRGGREWKTWGRDMETMDKVQLREGKKRLRG